MILEKRFGANSNSNGWEPKRAREFQPFRIRSHCFSRTCRIKGNGSDRFDKFECHPLLLEVP